MFDINQKTSEYMNLIVTHSCNKKCKFCIDSYVGENSFISIESVRKSLYFAKNKGVKDILVIGGEPTLHPDIVEICKMIKLFGFRCILTTNYTLPDVVRSLDAIVDCFNVSFYYQRDLPRQNDFVSDITIHAIIHKKQLGTRAKLDFFINKYEGYGHLKFSTLSVCNDFTKKIRPLIILIVCRVRR